MALIEVDADEFHRLRANAEALPSKTLLDKVGSDPGRRRRFLEMVKEMDPTANIPEIDASAPALERVGAIAKEFNEFKEAIEAERQERAKAEREKSTMSTIEQERAKLRAQGYQDEGITAVEKLMQDRGLTDYEAAAALLERSQPADEVILPNYDRSWNFATPDEGDDSSKLLVSGVNGARKWQSNEIQKFFREKREGKLRL